MKRYFAFLFFTLNFLLLIGQSCPITITANSTSICAGSSTKLYANGGSNYTWSTGATTDSIVVSPATTTTFSVTGTCNGSSSTATITINVNPLPNSNFTSSPNLPCANTPILFTNTSTGTGLTYSWNFGDPASGVSNNTSNLTNPSHTFSSAVGTGNQNFNVTLVATSSSGCSKTTIKQVSVKQVPNAAITDFNSSIPFTNCGSTTFTLEVTNTSSTASTNTSYTISWGDGSTNFSSTNWPINSTQNHTYTNLGFYPLLLTVNGPNGCSDTTNYSVYNGSNPAVGLGNPGGTVNICTPASLTFPITGTASNAPGTTYIITSNTGQAPINLNHPPPASYSYTFTTTSCGVFGANTPNAYFIRIKAINPCGFTESTVEPITTSIKPDAKMTISPDTIACKGSSITFTNSSDYGIAVNSAGFCDTLNKFNWKINPSTGWGPPSGSNNVISPGNQLGSNTPNNNPTTWGSKNLNVTFTQAGTYTITLVVGNSCGNDTIKRIVCIEEAPTPGFTISAQSGCAPFLPTINNTSTFQFQCKPAVVQWTITKLSSTCAADSAVNFRFINNTTSSSSVPSLRFNNQGLYIIKLTLTNKCGTFNFSDTIEVKRKPSITIASIPGSCGPVTIAPTATVVNCGVNPATFQWNFSGGTPSTSNQATPGNVSFSSLGTHTVSLTSANECGSSTVDSTFIISQPPVVNAGNNSSLCQGDSVTLNGSASSGISPYQFSWSSTPTGFTSTQQNPTASPTVNTTFSLTVTDANNCSSSNTVTYTVNPLPPLGVSSQSICIGQSATLTANGANQYLWSTGYTSPSITVTPTVSTTFSITGTNTVTGCVKTESVVITVNPLPVVNAGPGLTFCNQPIPTQITGNTPIGGTWTGTGVSSGGVFTPSNNGNFVLTYTYADPTTGCSSSDTLTASVITAQQANAGTGFTVCKNNAIIPLVGVSPPGGTWSGAGVSNNQFDASVAGAGNFVLTYSSGNGSCLITDTIQVNVLPTPNLTVNSPTICDGQTTNLNANGADTYSWSTGETTSSITVNPVSTTQFTITGTDISNGCSVSLTSTVTVNSLPAVNAGPPVVFCNQAIADTLENYTPAGGVWTGTGVTSNGIFTPFANGNFELIYTFTDQASGCFDSDTLQITVVSPQTINAGSGFNLCLNATPITLSGFSPVGGNWTGNGITGNNFNPNTAGSGPHTLTYSFGSGTCFGTDTINVFVIALPNLAVNNAVICGGQAATLNASGADTYLWSTGDTTSSIAISPSVSSGFTVTGTSTLTGCSTSATGSVSVNQLPVFNVQFDSIGCRGTAVVFNNTTTGAANYNWDFGDGNTSTNASPSNSYNAIGNFVVSLIATSPAGCTDTLIDSILVVDPPVVNFTSSPDQGCAPLDVQFTNLSTGTNVQFFWNFGNGDTTSLSSPDTITFQQGLNDTLYFVTLSATNLCGVTSLTDTILVRPIPVVNFGTNVNSGCSPLPIFFINTSAGNPTQYIWDYGDGTPTSSLTQSPPHTFFTGTSDTTYTITLIGINSCGSDTATRSILVHPNTVTSFFNTSITSGCGPLSVTFTNFSTGGSFYSWNFGDGNVSTSASVTHIYQTPGNYVCSLAVNNGCSYDTSTINITVFPGPQLAFSMTTNPACAQNPVQFNNTSVNCVNYQWDFGDGNSSVLTNPSNTYSGGGTYSVSLIGTSSTNGCLDTLTIPVLINGLPIPQFTTDTLIGCAPFTVPFNNTTQNGNFYSWDFGDGNTSAVISPVHTFTQPGTSLVVLVVENLAGCVDSLSASITTLPVPTSSFSLSTNSSCSVPVTVTPQNTSTGAISYFWDFGNGDTSTFNNPSVTYTTFGTDTIMLVTMNNFGCTDTAIAIFYPTQPPQIAFSSDTTSGCKPLEVNFINQTQFATDYLWYFGNGDSSLFSDPLYTFTDEGFYDITLIASNQFCADTLTTQDFIHVFPRPTADFSFNQVLINGISNGTVQFTNNSQNAVNYLWDFDDATQTNAFNPEHQFQSVGNYFVVLTAYNEFQCSDTAVRLVIPDYFESLFIPNAFMPENPHGGDSRLFLPKGKSIAEYKMEIYNTYGIKIFETTKLDASGSPAEGWDGTLNGKICQQDVYVWKISAVFQSGKIWEGVETKKGKIKNTGTVTLIR